MSVRIEAVEWGFVTLPIIYLFIQFVNNVPITIIEVEPQ